VSPRKAPVRPCSWHHCSNPVVARVRFELPNLLAGSERDYCSPHTGLVCLAKGDPGGAPLRPPATDPARPTRPNATAKGRQGRIRRKGVMP
jgi:hypothetical protein